MAYRYSFREGELEYTFKLGNNVWCDVREPYIEKITYDDLTQEIKGASITNSGCYIIDRVYGSGAMFDTASEIPGATATVIKADGTEYTRTIGWTTVPRDNTTDSLYIGDGITTIADYCFAYLNGNSQYYEAYYDYTTGECGYNKQRIIKNIAVTLGSGLRKIGERAFVPWRTTTEYSMLSSVTVKGNVEEIGLRAFQEQQLLTGIDFHHSPTIVNGGAFLNCHNLEYVNISDEWRSLDYTGPSYNTFDGCYKLSRISPKNKIKDIRGEMYRNCNMLTQVTIDDDDFGNYGKNVAMYVDLFAGDPESLDEEGYLITEVNEHSVINPYVLAYNWKDNWHRIIAYYTDKFLDLHHMGKHIRIREYTRGTLPLEDEDIQYFLKWVKLNGEEPTPLPNQTPLVVAHKGHWYQITY